MNADEQVLPAALAALAEKHRVRLADFTTAARFAPGDLVFRENDPATRCWLLHTGSVSLTTVVPGRGTISLETLHGGDILGWSWLGANPRWQFTAHATEATDATELDVIALQATAADEPAFTYAVTRALSEVLIARLHSTRARLLDLYAGRREE
ncbi:MULTISPECIES: cyclic nucleotide-binding domain-containing protein [unclassified Rhodococcus (in: high G+C Gram-positive bacteria)]|uniref:cyclic nucleotide-binding domain-containing protein n=1 Tax=unclassified Rhodococcus (in: high G+C Gram-positive bacteria) TaxID=192944 RepID=UPI0003158193|nr:cyclic nucleotide-binding domain-containing protein [Rhodococcus sp. DK17]